jgi:hypothetical protein
MQEVTTPSSLKHVDLFNNRIGEIGIDGWADCIAVNTGLESLNLAGNDLKKRSCRKMERLLDNYNINLFDLILGFDVPDLVTINHIVAICRQNEMMAAEGRNRLLVRNRLTDRPTRIIFANFLFKDFWIDVWIRYIVIGFCIVYC